MTPRVVRTVEELVNLPKDAALELATGGLARAGQLALEISQMPLRKRESLPATVLAPLSVTSEQVEAGARAMWVADAWGRPNPGREWDELTLMPVVYEKMRAMARAALAAMGIPVVDGE